MSGTGREIAKFCSGVAAMQAITHWVLGFSGELPITLAGITYTTGVNMAAMVVWPLITVALVCYAWRGKHAE